MASLTRAFVPAARSAAAVTVAPRSLAYASLRRFSSTTSALNAQVQQAGPAKTQTNRAEATLRRFWKHSNVRDEPNGYIVTLDHRDLKTPGGAKLVLPKDRRLLAALISNEWENQDAVLKQHALPLTSLAARAIDGLSDTATRTAVIDHLMEYLETDTVCYPHDKPAALVRLQAEHWDPLYKWLKDTYGVTLQTASGIMPATQSPETVEKLRGVVEHMDNFEIAALERAVYATKSFVIGLALVTGRLTAHQAAQAAHVEVSSNIENWGEVEDSHDVDYQDIRRSLGSVACLLSKNAA